MDLNKTITLVNMKDNGSVEKEGSYETAVIISMSLFHHFIAVNIFPGYAQACHLLQLLTINLTLP